MYTPSTVVANKNSNLIMNYNVHTFEYNLLATRKHGLVLFIYLFLLIKHTEHVHLDKFRTLAV